MNRSNRAIGLMALVAAALVVAEVRAVEVKQKNLAMEVDATGRFERLRVSANGRTLEFSGGLAFRDERGNPIAPTAARFDSGEQIDGAVAMSADYPFGKVDLALDVNDLAATLRFRVVNPSPEPQKITLVFGLDTRDKALSLYNGGDTIAKAATLTGVRRWSKPKHERCFFPLLGLYNADAGLAAALGADDFHSTFTPEARGADDGAVAFAWTMNLWLPADGGDYEGRLHWIPFSGKYDERDAIARYHALYPGLFKRRDDLDPRVHGFACGYQSWSLCDAELVRLTGGDWEWCIQPTRRTADIADEHWDYQPARPFSSVPTREFRTPDGTVTADFAASRDEWLAQQAARLRNARWTNVANGFYTLAHSFAEEGLAKQFPDALYGEHADGDLWRSGWGRRQDDQRTVFTYKTTWGDEVRRMMKEVIERDVPISAFAFDSPIGSMKYRGPALKNIDNVTWDKHGPYVASGVSDAKLYDFVHTLTKDGRTLGVINNAHLMDHVYEGFHADSCLLEANPWTRFGEYPYPLHTRYAFGEKAMSWWEGYRLEEVIDVEKLSRADRRDAVRGLADFTAHYSFRCGVTYPYYFSRGVEYLIRLIPAMRACVEAGWRPVPGFAFSDERLSPARYGQGLTAMLSVGAVLRDDVEDRLVCFNGELQGETIPLEEAPAPPLVFVDFFGHETVNEARARTVEIPVRVVGRKVKVLRCAMALNAGATGRVVVREDDRYDRLTIHATLEGDIESVALPLRRGHKFLARVALDGQALDIAKGERAARVSLPATGEFEAIYRSVRTDLTEEALIAFPFVNADNEPTFSLRCAPDADTRFLARRFLEFFRNAIETRRGLKKRSYELPVKPTPDASLPPGVLVARSAEAEAEGGFAPAAVRPTPFVSGAPDRGLVVLSGGSFENLEAILYDYMNLLGATRFADVIDYLRIRHMSSERLYLTDREKAVF